MEIIKNGEELLAIIYRHHEWSEGLNFITPPSLYIQAGTWVYPKGKILAAHIHKECARTTHKTQEVIYIKQGKVKAIIYDNHKNVITEVILETGDVGVLANGGHSYEILEHNTQVLEVKNGPFISVEMDKEKF